MNAKTLIAAVVALLGAVSVHASEVSSDDGLYRASTLTRAEVRQAAIQALNLNVPRLGETPAMDRNVSTKTRAQVVAETKEAIRLGAIDRYGPTTFASVEQLESIRQAGLKAVMPMEMASR